MDLAIFPQKRPPLGEKKVTDQEVIDLDRFKRKIIFLFTVLGYFV